MRQTFRHPSRSILLFIAFALVLPRALPGQSFLRGDASGDGRLDVSDPLRTLGFLFRGEDLSCGDAADSNDDGSVDISDPVLLLFFLFGSAASLPPPFPDAGQDATADTLSCDEYCRGGLWKDLSTGALLNAGLGMREPPVNVVYGIQLDQGSVVLPRCAYFAGPVRLPVLLVDWEDFEPVSDPSNENFPDSLFPSYVRSTPAELAVYLNGPGGPGRYFQDVSGGAASLSFEVYGWIRSGTPDSYLRPRSEYVYNLHDLSPDYPDPTWKCLRNEVFLDALRDAVVDFGLDLTRYDADGNRFLDGAILVYEGQGGLCSGGNLEWVNAGTFPGPPAAFDWLKGNQLVETGDPNGSLFEDQDLVIQYYNNLPERYPSPGDTFYLPATWAHELGHLLLGYPDYYYSRFNVSQWALSGNHGENPSHPAAFEKWLFARWISPVPLSASGTYTLRANEIADGDRYDRGPYLFTIEIDGDPRRFLSIENRWFDDAGNHGTRWAPAHDRESGLAIFEFNLAVDWFSDAPVQVYRHHPDRGGTEVPAFLRAFRSGDLFHRCYSSSCITIQTLDEPGEAVRFSLEIQPK